MIRFILRRFVSAIPLLFGITLISFLLLELAPGDFFTQLQQDPTIARETLDRYRRDFGIDRPLAVQYLYWLKNLCRGNLGISLQYRIPVMDLLLPRLGNTLALSISALLLSWLVAVPMGVVAARFAGSLPDRLLGFFSFVGLSVPEFLLAFFAIFLAAHTGWFPVGGTGQLDGDVGSYLWHLAAPAIVLTVGSVAYLQRLMRSNVLEELGKDYVRTARAKGLSGPFVLWRHAVPNAINPMITIFGMQLATVASGAALVENIMAWPGLGKLLLDATLSQDIYVVMASLLFGSLFLVLGNLCSDITLAFIDPRIRRAG